MSTYEGNLQNELENLLYRDRSRHSLKSTDLDVLSLFSGDEEAVIHGLKTFHMRHKDKTVIIHNGNNIEVKAYDLFPDPEQTKDGKFPQGRPYRRGKTWKR
jgi:hypothetical protein